MNRKPRIFVLQPNFNAVSEVWLDRMTELLQDHIIGIAAYNPAQSHCRNKIPVYNLLKPYYSIYQRILMKISPRLAIPTGKLIERQMLKKIRKADIVLVHFITTALENKDILLKSGCKIFIHAHGFDLFPDLRNLANNGKNYFSDNYSETVRELASNFTFIANSQFSSNKLILMGINPNKIHLKYFGVPLQTRKDKVNNDKLNILYLGRMVDFKGPDIVIKAFEKARSLGLNAELTMAGDGPLKPMCELLKFHSKYINDINIIGSVNYSQAEQLYKNADIYTMHNVKGPLSNQEEAFGVSIIEAMSFGLPVVTANSGAIAETVMHENTGFIVPQFDIEAHAQAFIILANNYELRMQMGINAQTRIKEYFTPEQEKERLWKILGLNE